jgi:hypothetical protein
MLVAESIGLSAIKIGGIESLGPPLGGMILAQPGPLIKIIVRLMKDKTAKNEKVFFINENDRCKHNV